LQEALDLSFDRLLMMMMMILLICAPGSSVGIATDYGLDGLGSNLTAVQEAEQRNGQSNHATHSLYKAQNKSPPNSQQRHKQLTRASCITPGILYITALLRRNQQTM